MTATKDKPSHHLYIPVSNASGRGEVYRQQQQESVFENVSQQYRWLTQVIGS